MPKVSFGTFSMEAPTDWTLSSIVLAGPMDESPGQGMLTTKAVKPFQRNMIVSMERVAPSETPQSYVQRQVEGLKQAGVHRQEAAPAEVVTLSSGAEGLLVEQIISQGGERMRQLQLVFIKDHIAHTAIGTHLDGASFERVRDEFRGMLLSFA